MESRLSPEYFRRKELMISLEIPTISEVKVLTGLPLASVIFEQCHDVLRADLGLKPYLEGPHCKLWTSPSDLLIGKVALKPPLTQKHIQALTHQGILELGSKVEQKLLDHLRMEKEQALQTQYKNMMALFEIQKADFIANIQKEADEKYGQQLRDMAVFYENKICFYLWECGQQIQELEEQLQIEIDSLNILWQEKLEYEIEETTKKITEEFLEKMRLQEQILVEIYTKQIKTLNIKKKCAIEFERTKCNEAILQMKHKLHCENIANLMYLLCKERRKCKYEKTQAENHYLAEIRKHKQNINKKTRIIRNLNRIKAKKTKQIRIREKCLIEILKQFQKFIYFALKAAPTQGEFLLNVNKLINFELDDYCLEKPAIKPKVEEKFEVVEEIRDGFQSEYEEFLKTSQEDEEEEEEMKCSDELPAFYFNDKMYVREDFRDMFSAGIEIDQKNSLWNPDVEELLQVFKESIKKQAESLPHTNNLMREQSSVHFTETKSSSKKSLESGLSEESTEIRIFSPDKTPPGSPKERSSKEYPVLSSPIRRISLEEKEEKEIRKYSLEESFFDEKLKKTPRSSKTNNVVRLSLTGNQIAVKSDPLVAQSRLSLARDSLLLHMSNNERKSIQETKITIKQSKIKEKMSVSIMDAEPPVHEEPVSTSAENDSKLEDISSHGSFKNATKYTSKLLLVTDSIEMIKSQCALNTDKEKQEEPVKQKSDLTVRTKVNMEGSDVKVVGKTMKKITSSKVAKKTSQKVAVPSTTKVSKAKIIGVRNSKEHEKNIKEFADERLKSLVNVMKESPSILRLFTSGVK